MLVVAHRGHHRAAQENTWDAFARAVELGCHRIELDVHLGPDQDLLVHHDEQVICGSGEKVHVSALSRQALSGLILSNGEALPLVPQVLDVLLPKIELNLEIKTYTDAMAESLGGVCHGHPLAAKIIVSSFDARPLGYLAARFPDLKRAWLVEEAQLGPRRARPKILQMGMAQAQSRILHPQLESVNEDLMKLAQSQGWEVIPWVPMKTHEDEGVWNRLKRWGVQGLCTNDPKGLL